MWSVGPYSGGVLKSYLKLKNVGGNRNYAAEIKGG